MFIKSGVIMEQQHRRNLWVQVGTGISRFSRKKKTYEVIICLFSS